MSRWPTPSGRKLSVEHPVWLWIGLALWLPLVVWLFRRRRLLLTNHDLGVILPSGTLQLGLNFATDLPELFAGKEMGEDALRVLAEYLKLYRRIQTDVQTETPLLRAATRWSTRLK